MLLVLLRVGLISEGFVSVGCPSERAMVLAHIRKQAFTAVIKETGLRGLYFGFYSTLYRDISFNMVFFTSREAFVRLYKNHYGDPDPKMRVMLGFPAGTLASIVACPYDVVKTRQQGSGLGEGGLQYSHLYTACGSKWQFFMFSVFVMIQVLNPDPALVSCGIFVVTRAHGI